MASVHWSVIAQVNLQSITAYLDLRFPGAADGLLDGIDAAVARHADFPMLGRSVPEWQDSNVREVLVDSFRIVYRVDKDDVLILGVVHGRQDILRFFRHLDLT